MSAARRAMSVTLTERHEVVVEELDRGGEQALPGLPTPFARDPPIGGRQRLAEPADGHDVGRSFP